MSARKENEDRYTVELRTDQWDLILQALESIRVMTTGDAQYAIDKLARQFLRRRCVETMTHIQSQIPSAEK